MTDINGASLSDGDAQGSGPADMQAEGAGDVSNTEPTPRAAIERAFDSLNVEAGGPEEMEEGGELPGQQRESTGEQPPARFSQEAKAAWDYAPPAIKAEIHRAVREMEAGIEKHREAAQQWESLRDYDALAQDYGTDIRGALDRYIAADMMLNQDLIGGLEQVVSHYGYSLYDIAAHVMGEQPDASRAQAEAQNRALRQELSQLRDQLGGVTQAMAQQQHYETQNAVLGFASAHPGFNQLADEIAFFIESGRASSLDEAYDLAERLQGGSSVHSARGGRRSALHQGLSAQTRKGALSVTGAPSSGSNPYNRKPPSSAREALDRAFANSGIG